MKLLKWHILTDRALQNRLLAAELKGREEQRRLTTGVVKELLKFTPVVIRNG